MSKKKYLVDASWTMAGSVYVEAEDRDEAEGLVSCIDLWNFEDADYVDCSFEVDSVSLTNYSIEEDDDDNRD